RDPSEALMAFRRTWVAAAAYGVYGSSASGWYVFVKSDTNVAPAPFSWSGGTPATDAYRPSAFLAPASSIVDWVVNPSGSSSLTLPVFGPSTATLCLISWPPFSQIRPPTMI